MSMSGLPDTLSAAEVARACHVSERTIRRWVVAGRLPGDLSGPTLRVAARDLQPWLASMSGQSANGQAGPDVRQAVGNGHSTSVTDTETARPDLTALVNLVADLQHQLVAKAEAAAMWQARADMLAGQLAALQQPALEAGTVNHAEAPPSPPWWARWLWWRRDG
jgi:hypothetical protein